LSVAGCKGGDGGSSGWEELSIQPLCIDDAEELIGTKVLCRGDVVSGTLNARSNPFDVYGFKSPQSRSYLITLRDFGDPATYDFDLYVLSVQRPGRFELIDASESSSAARESVTVDLEKDDAIRIEVEFRGQADVDRSYILSIDLS
jgi:hypothetical protein